MKRFIVLLLFLFLFCFLVDSEADGYMACTIFAALLCMVMPSDDDCCAHLTDEDIKQMHEEFKRKYDKTKP